MPTILVLRDEASKIREMHHQLGGEHRGLRLGAYALQAYDSNFIRLEVFAVAHAQPPHEGFPILPVFLGYLRIVEGGYVLSDDRGSSKSFPTTHCLSEWWFKHIVSWIPGQTSPYQGLS